jgi:hypothetical protein
MSHDVSRLIHTHQGRRVGEYPLSAERVTIGRHAKNTIRIADPAVSARHAVILVLENRGGVVLRDLDSTNGTYVNGKEVSEHPLRNGDVIHIGRHRLQYLEALGEDAADGHTMLIRVPKQPVSAAPPAVLRTLTGPNRGTQITLSRANTPVGEEGGQRAVIKRQGSDYRLFPLWGDTVPLVNGSPVGAEGCALNDRDVIHIAGTELEFLQA